MEKNNKKIIISCVVIGFVLLAGIAIALTNSNKTKNNEKLQNVRDIKNMLKTIYNNLGDNIPSLDTDEISTDDTEMVKSLTGLETTDMIDSIVVSQPMMNAQALEVAVIKTRENANINNMMDEIKNNVNMNRWICVSADKLYIASSGDVIFMVMADSDWAKNIYDEFVKYMDNNIDKTEEKDNSFGEDSSIPSVDIPVAD
ncbi:MAG: DUF4358 domain-containing protein [bacterium]|nr:DUF4358 domain-containing protein [bacterium]